MDASEPIGRRPRPGRQARRDLAKALRDRPAGFGHAEIEAALAALLGNRGVLTEIAELPRAGFARAGLTVL